MLRKTVLAVAIALGTCAGAQLLVGTPTAFAQEKKEEKKKQGVSPKVGKLLKPAQEAMKNEQWAEAAAKIREAQALPERTPFDDYQINEFLFFVSVKQGEPGYPEAAKALEQVVNSGFMPEEVKAERTRNLAQLLFQTKDYAKSIEYGKRWIEMSGGTAGAYELVGQAQYLTEDNASAIATLNQAVEAAKKAGEPVKEQWLQVILSAYDRTEDSAGVSKTLEALVEHAPTEKYWEQLLDTVYATPDNDDRTVLEIHRLRNEIGVLKRADDYVEMSDIAAAVGIPAEAARAMEKALAAPDAQAKDKERRSGRLSELKRTAETDRKSLPGLEKEAATATGSGEFDYALGVGLLSFDQYDQATAALKRAVQKGKLKRPDEAQIMLGRSLLKSNQKEEARAAFQAVPANSKLARIARLWAIYANQV